MALFEKTFWGAFWRLLAKKRALSNLELLLTLQIIAQNTFDRESRRFKAANIRLFSKNLSPAGK